MGERIPKRECAKKSMNWLDNHYSTSFEDSQTSSQDWLAENHGHDLFAIDDDPNASNLVKGQKKDSKRLRVIEEGTPDEMRLIDDTTKANMESESKVVAAENQVYALQLQLTRYQADTESTLQFWENTLAQCKLELAEAHVDKSIAEKMRDARQKELREALEGNRRLRKELQEVEAERDAAIAERDSAQRELHALKMKLNKLASL
ncbi:hypothetical protein MPER_13180 [Moniliophthora perniciosa FA553]|nr:hypothetical protein MPER_13180 [Moniliophthora perniciosa FA553]